MKTYDGMPLIIIVILNGLVWFRIYFTFGIRRKILIATVLCPLCR